MALAKNPKTGKRYTPAEDAAADRKAGIKEGSKRDNALDRKRGVPVKPAVVIVVGTKPKGGKAR